MALSQPVIQSTIRAALDAEYGVPADAVERDKLAKALADAVLTILTSQLVVTTIVPAGSSAGSYVGVNS